MSENQENAANHLVGKVAVITGGGRDIDTDFHDTFTKPEVRSLGANITQLKREGSSEDVVNLASDGAAFITGANIDINGGMLFS